MAFAHASLTDARNAHFNNVHGDQVNVFSMSPSYELWVILTIDTILHLQIASRIVLTNLNPSQWTPRDGASAFRILELIY